MHLCHWTGVDALEWVCSPACTPPSPECHRGRPPISCPSADIHGIHITPLPMPGWPEVGPFTWALAAPLALTISTSVVGVWSPRVSLRPGGTLSLVGSTAECADKVGLPPSHPHLSGSPSLEPGHMAGCRAEHGGGRGPHQGSCGRGVEGSEQQGR